jgi:hypothetical protein
MIIYLNTPNLPAARTGKQKHYNEVHLLSAMINTGLKLKKAG